MASLPYVWNSFEDRRNEPQFGLASLIGVTESRMLSLPRESPTGFPGRETEPTDFGNYPIRGNYFPRNSGLIPTKR
jgi:hypothetical protein